MLPACPNPCSDCPFRKDSMRGWLGSWPSAAHLSGHILAGNKFPCHMTMPDASDYEDMGTDEPLGQDEIDDLIMHDSTRCKGAMLYKEKAHAKYLETPITSQHDSILAPDEFLYHHDREALIAAINNPAPPCT